MRSNHFHAFSFLFFGCVEKKEVDQYGIHIGIWSEILDLPSDKLNAPNAAASELHFPGVTGFNRLRFADAVIQRRAILYTAKSIQHLGDTVV